MYPTLAVSSSLYKDEEEICANRYSTHAYNKATEKKNCVAREQLKDLGVDGRLI